MAHAATPDLVTALFLVAHCYQPSPVHWVFFFLPTLNMFTFPDLKDLPDLKKKNHFDFSG